jgi:uncharacterized protein YndB with AHSA1/START domain
MAKVSMTTELNVPADEVWKLIGGFNALPDWHPAVTESHTEGEGEGSVRRLSLAGGGTIVERLERVDDGDRLYSYSIIDSPLPVPNYKATIRVRDKGDGTAATVEWSSEFSPSGASEGEASEAIQGIYDAGFENLKKIFGR